MPVDSGLHKACHAGNLDEVQRLLTAPLEEGCEPIDINAPGAGDRRPIHRAAGANKVEIVQLLIEKGALVDQQDKSGRTAIHWAAISGHVQVGKILVESGANIAVTTPSGMTPLHAACEGGHPAFVEFILKTVAEQDALADETVQGAETQMSKLYNTKDADGKLPFDLAIAGKHKAVVTLLKGNGDPNAQSSSCIIS